MSVEEEMDQITYGGATYRQEDKRDGQISNGKELLSHQHHDPWAESP